MPKIKIHWLSFLLVGTAIFLNTCSASTAQPLRNPTVTSTNIALAEVIAESPTAGTPKTADEGTPIASIVATPSITPTAYLPFVDKSIGKFLGVYFDQYWTADTVSALTQIDQEAGKGHTSVGWFIDLQDIAFTSRQNDNNTNNFYRQLEALWNKGYISFVNLGSALQISDYDVTDNCPVPFSSSQIASGECDPAIQKMADLYYQWVSLGGGRRAMIAPLQEMNGVWTSYGKDPNTSDQFKEAYRHILGIFADRGITRNQVWWVFAPNGYNDADKPEREFENYYPGDDVVDIVGFSSYNYGYCIEYPQAYWRWESYPQIFEPYIARMQTMAPSKPIILAEIASTAYYHDGEGNPVIDYDQMNQWLIENYDYFASRDGVIGVFYFSFQEYNGVNCEIVIDPNGIMLSGYVEALSNPVYKYFNAADLDSLIH
jgi:hypothetical protein